MPRLDGLEVLQELRQTSNLPVVFLTSKDEEIDQLLGLKMGADDYITKPFSQKLLLERVKTILDYQFGEGIGKIFTDGETELVISKKTKRICSRKLQTI